MIVLKNPVPVYRFSSSLSGSLIRLLSSAKWMSAALPQSRWCTNLWIVHHQSANLEQNLYRACDPWHMHQDWKIEQWEGKYVYTHIRVGHLPFRSTDFPHYHQVAQVAFPVEMAPVLVEVHASLCASSLSVDALLCHFGKEGSCPCDFHKQLPVVYLSQPSPFHAQEIRHPVSSVFGRLCDLSWLVVVFPL